MVAVHSQKQWLECECHSSLFNYRPGQWVHGGQWGCWRPCTTKGLILHGPRVFVCFCCQSCRGRTLGFSLHRRVQQHVQQAVWCASYYSSLLHACNLWLHALLYHKAPTRQHASMPGCSDLHESSEHNRNHQKTRTKSNKSQTPRNCSLEIGVRVAP